mgnify:CR=1 FL=1
MIENVHHITLNNKSLYSYKSGISIARIIIPSEHLKNWLEESCRDEYSVWEAPEYFDGRIVSKPTISFASGDDALLFKISFDNE